jgi:hypothetical protein
LKDHVTIENHENGRYSIVRADRISKDLMLLTIFDVEQERAPYEEVS